MPKYDHQFRFFKKFIIIQSPIDLTAIPYGTDRTSTRLQQCYDPHPSVARSSHLCDDLHIFEDDLHPFFEIFTSSHFFTFLKNRIFVHILMIFRKITDDNIKILTNWSIFKAKKLIFPKVGLSFLRKISFY